MTLALIRARAAMAMSTTMTRMASSFIATTSPGRANSVVKSTCVTSLSTKEIQTIKTSTRRKACRSRPTKARTSAPIVHRFTALEVDDKTANMICEMCIMIMCMICEIIIVKVMTNKGG